MPVIVDLIWHSKQRVGNTFPKTYEYISTLPSSLATIKSYILSSLLYFKFTLFFSSLQHFIIETGAHSPPYIWIGSKDHSSYDLFLINSITPIPPFARPKPNIGLCLSDLSSDKLIELQAESNLWIYII